MTRSEAAAIARATKAANAPSLEQRFWSKVVRLSPDVCWLWNAAPRRKDEGYGAFYFEGRHQPSHRVAWILTYGAIGEGLLVCHHCDIPGCCNPSHLFLGTHGDNDADCVAKRRKNFGSSNWRSKFTEAQVLCLRLLNQMFGLRIAAQRMNINYFTAWDLCNRSWRHI